MTKPEFRELMFEQAETIQKCRELTQKAVILINEAQEIFNKWEFKPLSINQYEEMAAGNYNPMGYIMEQAARSAVGLQKLLVKHESIMQLIGLPVNYDVFESKIKKLQEFTQSDRRSVQLHSIVFSAISIQNGLAVINEADFDKYVDQFRVYAKNDAQLKIMKAGEDVAGKLFEFQNLLRDAGLISNSGFNTRIELDTRFFTHSENGIKLRYSVF